MILRRISITAALLLVLSFAPAQAQNGETKFGVGVGLDPIASILDETDSVFSPVTLYFPIQADGFRIEPQFGLFRRSRDSGSGTQASSRTATALELGAGVFATPQIGDNTIAHLGGRLGIVRFSESISGPNTDDSQSATDFFIGPAAGGEHFLSDNFSLGGEVQLIYVNVGEGDSGDTDISLSRISTGAVFFARIYF